MDSDFGDSSEAAKINDLILNELRPANEIKDILEREFPENAERVLSGMSGSRPLSDRLDPEVVGLDIKKDMIQLDNGKLSIQGNIVELPFKDDSFDAMYILGCSIPYLEDKQVERAFEESRRVLNEGSPLIVDYYRPGSIAREEVKGGKVDLDLDKTVIRKNVIKQKEDYFEWLRTYIVEEENNRREIGPTKHIMREYHENEIEKMMEEAGFQDICSRPLAVFFREKSIFESDKLAYTVGYSS